MSRYPPFMTILYYIILYYNIVYCIILIITYNIYYIVIYDETGSRYVKSMWNVSYIFPSCGLFNHVEVMLLRMAKGVMNGELGKDLQGSGKTKMKRYPRRCKEGMRKVWKVSVSRASV
jgi:hypothetical protein